MPVPGTHISTIVSSADERSIEIGLHPLLEDRRMRANGKALDIPHVLSINATDELPFGEGRRLMSSGWDRCCSAAGR